MDPSSGEITRLLQAVRAGNPEAADLLFRAVYHDMAQIARRQMGAEPADHTWQTTALVHEAYLRLGDAAKLEHLENRRHFYATVVTVMRNLLLDHARARRAAKRGGGRARVVLDSVLEQFEAQHRVDFVELDEVLTMLAARDARQCQIVELRLLAGFDSKEVAEQLGVSASTVEKDFRVARAWLHAKLS